MEQLSLFNSEAFKLSAEYISSDNWDAEIISKKGKRVVILHSPDGPSKIYRWPNPDRRQVRALLIWAEKLGDFPDLASPGGHQHNTYSVDLSPLRGRNLLRAAEKEKSNEKKKRQQSGWIQKSYRLRVGKKQKSIAHWQPRATGPYYCYRYKTGNKTTGIYLRRDRHLEISAAIDAGKTVLEILKMLP